MHVIEYLLIMYYSNHLHSTWTATECASYR